MEQYKFKQVNAAIKQLINSDSILDGLYVKLYNPDNCIIGKANASNIFNKRHNI